MMKKLMNSILVISLLAMSGALAKEITYAASTPALSDIANHWAADSIRGAVQKGYVDGYEDGTFRPDREVSRAEFIKLVAAGLDKGIKPDETSLRWYMPYVKSLQEAGIIRKDFFLDDMEVPMQRGEMATILPKAVDVNAEASMYEAVKMGLINGVDRGELAPEGTTTRAQAVTVIERILKARNGEKLPVDRYAVVSAELKMYGTNMKSKLGIEPTEEIGKWYEIQKGVQARIKNIVVADPNDPNDPFMHLFSLERMPPREKLEDVVILGFYLEVKVTKEAYEEGGRIWSGQRFGVYNTSGRVRLNDQDKEIVKGAISLEKEGIYVGWDANYYLKDTAIQYGIEYDLGGKRLKIVNK
jgi:hypothetical protein